MNTTEDLGGTPPTPPEAKQLYVLCLDTDHYLAGAPAARGIEAVVAQNTGFIASFKKDLSERLKALGQQEDAVEFIDQVNWLGMLLIKCTAATAQALKTLPGVAAVQDPPKV